MQINLQHKSYSCVSTVCVTMKHLLSCSKNKQSHFIPFMKTNQFIQCNDRFNDSYSHSEVNNHRTWKDNLWVFLPPPLSLSLSLNIKQITYFYQLKFSCSKVCHWKLQSSTVVSCTWFFFTNQMQNFTCYYNVLFEFLNIYGLLRTLL